MLEVFFIALQYPKENLKNYKFEKKTGHWCQNSKSAISTHWAWSARTINAQRVFPRLTHNTIYSEIYIFN